MSKHSWLACLPLIILIGLVTVFALALKHGGGEEQKFAQHIDEPAPLTVLSALNSDQSPFSTRAWLGRPYLINFFASWCVPCRSEHESLLQLAKAGLPIIGIAYKDKTPAVAKFLAREGNPYAIAVDDSSGRSGIDWGITGVPETFVIDAKGMIRFHAVGPMSEDMIDRQLLPVWSEVKG